MINGIKGFVGAQEEQFTESAIRNITVDTTEQFYETGSSEKSLPKPLLLMRKVLIISKLVAWMTCSKILLNIGSIE